MSVVGRDCPTWGGGACVRAARGETVVFVCVLARGQLGRAAVLALGQSQ